MVLSKGLNHMANILLLLLSLASGLTYNVVNLSIKNHIRTQAETYLFNAVSALFTPAVLLVMTAVQGEMHLPSQYTLLLALLFGAVTALAAILNMHAFGKGPMSYTTVIISCSMSSRLCSLCFRFFPVCSARQKRTESDNFQFDA